IGRPVCGKKHNSHTIMIIWRGFGILVVVITVVITVMIYALTGMLSGNWDYYKIHNSPNGIAFVLSGVAVYLAGLYLNKQPGRVLIDKVTRKEVVLRNVHSMFFIP